MIFNEDFQVHNELNNKIWGNDTKLLSDVREAIVNIVDEFEQECLIPIHIVDIQLCGSNASYNYTNESDLDVHIIASFDDVDADKSVLQSAYNLAKSNFNNDYNLTIHGIEVELYVQDVKSNVASNGIYSVCDNKWIKEPKPIKSITKYNIDKDIENWKDRIEYVLSGDSYLDIQEVVDNLYLMRKNSISVDGEYGKGNQLFKEIRSLGLLSKLRDTMKELKTKELSLEAYNGAFVNRFKD